MNKLKKTAEQQQDHIFDIFCQCHSETVPGRLQVYYPSLCEQIYIWYRDYLSIDVDRMGLEIARVINRFIKADTIAKIPQGKDGFFKYLNASINKEKAGYYREYNESETIKIPKEKRQKLREIEDFIRMKECQLGRTLTPDEKTQGISKWFKKQEYIDLLNSLNVGSISSTGKDGSNEIDILNYSASISDNPLDEYIKKIDMEIVREAIESIIEKNRQEAEIATERFSPCTASKTTKILNSCALFLTVKCWIPGRKTANVPNNTKFTKNTTQKLKNQVQIPWLQRTLVNF